MELTCAAPADLRFVKAMQEPSRVDSDARSSSEQA
jgi:hypothetical protein